MTHLGTIKRYTVTG